MKIKQFLPCFGNNLKCKILLRQFLRKNCCSFKKLTFQKLKHNFKGTVFRSKFLYGNKACLLKIIKMNIFWKMTHYFQTNGMGISHWQIMVFFTWPNRIYSKVRTSTKFLETLLNLTFNQPSVRLRISVSKGIFP